LPSLSRFTVATLAPVPTSLAFTIRISSDCAGFGHVGLIDISGVSQGYRSHLFRRDWRDPESVYLAVSRRISRITSVERNLKNENLYCL
jgi:hypothetical protein